MPELHNKRCSGRCRKVLKLGIQKMLRVFAAFSIYSKFWLFIVILGKDCIVEYFLYVVIIFEAFKKLANKN